MANRNNPPVMISSAPGRLSCLNIIPAMGRKQKIAPTIIWNQIYVSPGDPTKFFHVLNKPKPGLMSALPAV